MKTQTTSQRLFVPACFAIAFACAACMGSAGELDAEGGEALPQVSEPAQAVGLESSALTAPEENAAPEEDGQVYAAPTCIKARVTSGGGVTVTNECSEQRNIKVLFAYGADSSCIPLPAGYYVHVNKPNPGARFDGVNDC